MGLGLWYVFSPNVPQSLEAGCPAGQVIEAGPPCVPEASLQQPPAKPVPGDITEDDIPTIAPSSQPASPPDPYAQSLQQLLKNNSTPLN